MVKEMYGPSLDAPEMKGLPDVVTCARDAPYDYDADGRGIVEPVMWSHAAHAAVYTR